jgi:hypothetical protein
MYRIGKEITNTLYTVMHLLVRVDHQSILQEINIKTTITNPGYFIKQDYCIKKYLSGYKNGEVRKSFCLSDKIFNRNSEGCVKNQDFQCEFFVKYHLILKCFEKLGKFGM